MEMSSATQHFTRADGVVWVNLGIEKHSKEDNH